jgi:hypothetical protein
METSINCGGELEGDAVLATGTADGVHAETAVASVSASTAMEGRRDLVIWRGVK